jgi:predicted naringenin-chalcone synthase
MPNYALTNFQVLRPKHELSQEEGIEWLASAHAEAESHKIVFTAEQKEEQKQKFINCFLQWGCKPEHIQKRGHELSDFLHQNWQEMEIFQLNQSSEGIGLGKRQEFHKKMTDAIFEKYYPCDAQAPNNLIHVSCTGYSSPSSAQHLVSKRNWGSQTLVTHAYHMGCYASIPAIRMGTAFVNHKGGTTDIVHTELCSLHFNAANHNADQIVLQSLFADGYIKYTIHPVAEAHRLGVPCMEILNTHEQMIPESLDAMTWSLTDWGFYGTLSKKIPVFTARHAKDFVYTLCQQAGLNAENLIKKSLFAVHPGGPKILDYIQDVFEIRPEQLLWSRKILKQYGNISSATLPHIWDIITKDESVLNDTPVISLAFGPGLNIAGALLVKKT